MPRFRGDPAPTEMIETVINLKPRSEWRAGLTVDGLIADLDKALQFPGISNAWTMPIKARTDMRMNVATSGTDFTAPEADFVALIRQSEYPLPRNSLFQTPQIIRSPNDRYVHRVEDAIRDFP
jgi:hypothetical protein